MFNLDQAIEEWRRQMLGAGINDSGVLDELESHLREEMRERVRSGSSEPDAFDAAVRQIGESAVLEPEFAKVGETSFEQLKRFLCVLAGIPNYQLATNMNTPNQNLEPGWATYLKTAAFIVPATFFWVGSCLFVVPKLKEICVASGTAFPRPILTALALSDLFRIYFIPATVVILTTVILLEWRSCRWPRYRRLVFGIAAFFLNFTALILITTMLVFAVVAGASLLHAK